MHAFATVDEIIDHLQVMGRTRDGEALLDHGLHCATLLRHADSSDSELQIAGLLHDIGHCWEAAGQPGHERLGATAVRLALGDRVARLIEGHVAAKRYLVATTPGYAARLSTESARALASQGGPMDNHEAGAFELDPDCTAMVALRVADDDDDATVIGARVAGLEFWVPVLRALAPDGCSSSDRGRDSGQAIIACPPSTTAQGGIRPGSRAPN